MAFTAQDVKELRERTGCGMMECKKALSEADGDMEKAMDALREKGLAAAAKKAHRIAAEGMVFATSNIADKLGVIIEVNSETDFVAKNESFRQFVADVANVIEKQNPADVETLLTLPLGDGTVESALQEKILVIGENMKIRRFERYEGVCVAYVHGGGTHGVLVNFDTTDAVAAKDEFVAYGRDVAMQIAAVNPQYVRESEISAEVIAHEKEIFTAQAMNEGKPQEIAEKMVAGRIKKYFKEICLEEQQFVKNPDVTVLGYTNDTAKALGGDIKINNFVRWEKGEGLEKRQDNFAEEVMGQIK